VPPQLPAIFSERELTFTFAICCHPSVCRLSSVCLSSVTFVQYTLLSRLKFSVIFIRRLIRWPSTDIHRKFYGDRPRGTPPPGELNTYIANIAILDLSTAISRKRCKIRGKLVIITNRKWYMRFRLVPKSVTLNDREQRNGPYFALFHRIR